MDYFSDEFMGPPQSYSRKMDERIWAQEKPYGYTAEPPPADTRNFDQRALESDCRISLRKHGKR